MTLSIIIVSWNVKELLIKCLDSIFKNQGDLDLEVIVVDNNSADGTAETVNKKQLTINNLVLIKNDKNLGFAGANNQGIEIAKGKYILLLNPDTEILSNTLQKMVQFMDEYSDCGIASCKHLNPDGSLQPSVRRLPDIWSQVLILFKIYYLWPNLKIFQNYFAKNFDYQKTQEAEQVPGSFMLIRREVINKIGGLDEIFYLWFEDVDYCFRAKAANFKIYYITNASIIHHGGQSFYQKLVFGKQIKFFKSMFYYFWKNGLKN